MREISVYLFLGFLESGKTKFIQETLEDPRMEDGGKTLLLVCEEGVEEYDPKRFKVKSVVTEYVEDEKDLTMERLTEISKRTGCTRVVCEFNGMWLLQQFFDAMPENWVINQMMTFFDAGTFLNYNANMRQLVYDKIYMTQMVVLNRVKDSYDRGEFHKVVRAVSRRPDIVYENMEGKADFDDTVDPLPFDVDAPVIEVEDKDFALFYRDLNENAKSYVGKTVKVKGMAAVSKKISSGTIVIGRHIMTCCEADIAYDGFALKHNNLMKDIKTKDWLTVTAKIAFEYSSAYRQAGPVLVAESIERADPPEQFVATYF